MTGLERFTYTELERLEDMTWRRLRLVTAAMVAVAAVGLLVVAAVTGGSYMLPAVLVATSCVIWLATVRAGDRHRRVIDAITAEYLRREVKLQAEADRVDAAIKALYRARLGHPDVFAAAWNRRLEDM